MRTFEDFLGDFITFVLFVWNQTEIQESIPVGCVPPALHRCSWGWVSPWQRPPWIETPPRQRPSQKEHGTRDRDPHRRSMGPGSETGSDIMRPPGYRPPWKEHGTRDRDPLEGTWDQAAKQEVTSYRNPLPPCEQNDRHTPVQILPCPKRLRAVIKQNQKRGCQIYDQ